MSDLLEQVYTELKENKQAVEEGRINGIPFPYEPLQDAIPIIKRGQYHLITAKTKHSKSQFANDTFIFNTLFYAYNHPEYIVPTFLYFNWEEGDDEILKRFMVHCLYKFTNHAIRLSPIEIESPDRKRLLSDEVLAILESEEYKKIFQFFVDHVKFCSDFRTSVAVDIQIKAFAREHGILTFKESYYNDENGVKHSTKSIETYTPKDPKEYVFLIFDHVSLIQSTKSQTLLQAIGDLSKQCVTYKNIFKYIPVVIQQQSKELGGLEASKQGRIRPDDTFLSDCKSTVNECTHFWGICDPVAFNISEYMGYDLTKLGHNLRMLELIVNRKGEGNKLLPLYFDGAVNYFTPLPPANDKEAMQTVYNWIQQRNNRNKSSILTILRSNKSKKLRNNGKLYNYLRKKWSW